MDHADWERAAAVYLPLTAAIIARLLNGRQPRQFAACLLSVLWTVPSLLVVQRFNEYAGWWDFPAGSAVVFRGMPLELFLGWALLWGLIPQLALPRLGIAWSAAIMVAVDCISMPMCSPAIRLKPRWLTGEAVAVAVVLIPALAVGKWTRDNSHLRLRAGLQIATSGLLFLFLVPEIIFALRPGIGWAPLLHLPSWARQVNLQIILLLAVPGIAAVLEFAERGLGTPIPYDPPQRLVTSGIYRYCANPMQVSCTLVMLAGRPGQERLDGDGRLCISRLQRRNCRVGRAGRPGPSIREGLAGLSVGGRKLVAQVEAVSCRTARASLHSPELRPVQRSPNLAGNKNTLGLADSGCRDVAWQGRSEGCGTTRRMEAKR